MRSRTNDEFDSRDVLRELSQSASGRLSFHELADLCGIPSKRRPRFRKFLKKLLADGAIRTARGRTYRLGGLAPEPTAFAVEGVVRRHPDGYGFLVREDDEDLFLPVREMEFIFDGDRVRAIPVPGRYGRQAGRVVEIAARGRPTVVGRYRRVGAGERVEPDRQLYDAPIELVPGAVTPRDGEIVEVEIRDYPSEKQPAVGRIVSILGAPGELGTLVETVIRRHGLGRLFPDAVLEEAAALPNAPSAADRKDRRDLRDVPTFTIDGEDARDFDDAVSIDALPAGGFVLRVSIADVSHYVLEGSPLDREAFERGTSVYFPDRVIPMLPERLSNGIASLRPGEERLTLTAEMAFDAHGRRTGTEVYESVIRSWGRWTYTKVASALAGESVADIDPHRDRVQEMRGLMSLLQAQRRRRGSIDFDLPEPQVILDLQGRPEDVVRSERTDAHRLIEEFMIAANEAVADWLVEAGRPAIFRVHAAPDTERVREFLEFAKSYGHVPEFGATVSSQALTAFLEQIRGMPAERAINQILLRTMMRAEYSAENTGHFGLASPRYLHFTSPIRRYPDLVVHRLAKALKSRSPSPEDASSLQRIARQSTEREFAASRCEYDVVDVMRAYFFADRVGEEFDGVISGVIEDGFFVELLDVYVEGMVRVENLTDDEYRFMRGPRLLLGRRRKRRFSIGDPVRVAIHAVHVPLGRIEMRLVRGGSVQRAR